jgi:hypothetical protein
MQHLSSLPVPQEPATGPGHASRYWHLNLRPRDHLSVSDLQLTQQEAVPGGWKSLNQMDVRRHGVGPTFWGWWVSVASYTPGRSAVRPVVPPHQTAGTLPSTLPGTQRVLFLLIHMTRVLQWRQVLSDVKRTDKWFPPHYQFTTRVL